ncbi:MAG: peptidylprolyl isomerase [Actinobacteria bacterium]|nr:peptidylprolyl isomerase [Actinomycetota bacterium]
MIRRLALASGSLASLALLVSCTRFDADIAATVNGHELTIDQLQELAEGNDDPAVLRAALSTWIQVVAASEDPGELLTEEALAAERELILPPLIDSVQNQAQADYEQGLAGSPLLCLAVIPIAAETTSDSVLRGFAAGVSFADLATRYSDDPSLVESGGVISVDGQECLPIDQWNVDLVDQLTTEDAVVGEPVVVSLNGSEVIVLLRPFEELTQDSKDSLAQGPVSELLLERYQDAEVTVNKRFGVWDAEQGAVVTA